MYSIYISKQNKYINTQFQCVPYPRGKTIWLYCACRNQSESFLKRPIPTLHGSKKYWNSGSIFQEFVVTFETLHCVFHFVQFQFLAFEEISTSKKPPNSRDSWFHDFSSSQFSQPHSFGWKFLRNGLRLTMKTVPQAGEDAMPAAMKRRVNGVLWHARKTPFLGVKIKIPRSQKNGFWMVKIIFFHLYIWV